MSYPESLTVPLGDLVPNPWNSNVMSPENEAKLDEALNRFGFFKPIIVRELDEGYEILGGQHRWESAGRLGHVKVPIFNLGPIDDNRAKEIGLADNARYGYDDAGMLADIFKDLGDTDELQEFLPLSDSDLRAIFDSSHIALDELDIPETHERREDSDEPASAKAPKTHTIMRFKLSLGDAERATELITKIAKRHGYTKGDDLINAGDALVHLLFDAETGDE